MGIRTSPKITIAFLIIILLAIATPEALPAKVTRTPEAIRKTEERKLELALKNLDSENVMLFEKAVYKLEQIGVESVPHLIKILRDKDSSRKLHINTIYTLGRLGKVATHAAPAIASFLRSEDDDIKAIAAIALGKIGPEYKDSVIPLGRLLFNKDRWVAKSAEEALKRIGTKKAKEKLQEYYKIKKKKGLKEIGSAIYP